MAQFIGGDGGSYNPVWDGKDIMTQKKIKLKTETVVTV